MRRRSVLATAGSLLSLGSAGCLSKPSPPPARVGWFGVHNADPDSAHEFELCVERDGETVHESTHTVPPAEKRESGWHLPAAVADCTWGETAGDYTVAVQMDGEQTVERSVGGFVAATDADCVVANAVYRREDSRVVDRKGPLLDIYLTRDCDEEFAGKCGFASERV